MATFNYTRLEIYSTAAGRQQTVAAADTEARLSSEEYHEQWDRAWPPVRRAQFTYKHVSLHCLTDWMPS
jgi:hypothetical protein